MEVRNDVSWRQGRTDEGREVGQEGRMEGGEKNEWWEGWKDGGKKGEKGKEG